MDQPTGDRPDRPTVSLTPGDPLAVLSSWLAAGRVDEAARSRARQRWLQRQAEEESTFGGVLVDLAERRRPVLLTTIRERSFRGPIRAVGADFAVIHENGLGDVLIRLRAVSMVRPAPGDSSGAGDRPLTVEMVMSETLVELAADRPAVLVGTGRAELRGELRTAGIDVASVVLDGPRRDVVHLNTATVDYLAILSR